MKRTALLTTLLLFSTTCLSAGWTITPATIKRFYANSDRSGWIKLDTNVSVENPNNCANHNNWFHVMDLDTNLGRVNWEMLKLAYSLNHRIVIHSNRCDETGNYNEVTSISLDRTDN